MRNLINVQKIQQHFIKVIKLTREAPKPLIYRRREELIASLASYLRQRVEEARVRNPNFPNKLSKWCVEEARVRNPNLHHALGLG